MPCTPFKPYCIEDFFSVWQLQVVDVAILSSTAAKLAMMMSKFHYCNMIESGVKSKEYTWR